MDYIKSFNYLNYDGGQFSTSQKRGVFMNQALDLLPSDYWRWWLLSHAPESSDSEFTWENFQLGINKDLADVLGNFVSRVTKFCYSKFDSKVPKGGKFGAQETKLISNLEKKVKTYESYMNQIEIRKSASELRAIWALGNEYLQVVQPWATIKDRPLEAAMQIRLALNLIHLYAILSTPFIPDASKTIMDNLRKSDSSWPKDLKLFLDILKPGDYFEVPENLFEKISDEMCGTWKSEFSGEE